MPHLIISIDAEGDDLWSKPDCIETKNAMFIGRFQELCERYAFPVSYLTNYEMAMDECYQEFALDVIKRSVGEVGMHLHAWNSPPLFDLTGNDMRNQPYLIEYPKHVRKEKIRVMTLLLQEIFQAPITAHRAGRWAVNKDYIAVLTEYAYLVDCSITPNLSWKRKLGDPNGGGGPDYRRFPEDPYRMSAERIHKRSASGMLQVPMSIRKGSRNLRTEALKEGKRSKLDVSALLRSLGKTDWFRPTGSNRNHMLEMARQAVLESWPVLQFMLHSSELMPGGSPSFRDPHAIDMLYEDLDSVFDFAKDKFSGITLSGYWQHFSEQTT